MPDNCPSGEIAEKNQHRKEKNWRNLKKWDIYGLKFKNNEKNYN